MQQISNFRLLCKNAFVATKILLSMFKWFLNFFKMKWLRNFLQDAFESKKASAWLGEWPVNHGNDWFSSLDHLAPSPSTLASRPKRNNQLWPLQSHQERLNNQRDDTGEPMGAFILGKHLQNDQWVRFRGGRRPPFVSAAFYVFGQFFSLSFFTSFINHKYTRLFGSAV